MTREYATCFINLHEHADIDLNFGIKNMELNARLYAYIIIWKHCRNGDEQMQYTIWFSSSKNYCKLLA